MGQKVKLFFIICAIPAFYGQCNVERAEDFFKRSLHEFNIGLATRISQDTENHFVASSLSVWSLISALSLGATGTTYEEIKHVLRLHNHKCFNRKGFEVIEKVTSSDTGDAVERSSVILVDDSLSLNIDFEYAVNRTRISNVVSLPIFNHEEAALTINNYVYEATHGKIEDIVQPSDLNNVLLVLIDALYFKEDWTTSFDDSDTDVSSFYDDAGNLIGDVNSMFKSDTFYNTRIDVISADILELPYGSGDKHSMLIFLPFTGTSAEQVLQNLLKTSLTAILGQLRYKRSTVNVQLPRFQISSDLTLEDFLIDMGLRTMFDESYASFGGLSDTSLHVSSFLQKAFIEVTEKGTTAAAVVHAELTGRSLNRPSEFNVNKPFLYMIVDKKSEIALFTGIYSKPTIY